MAMRRIFRGFLQKLVPHRSLTLSSRSDFGFEFAEIFVIKKRLLDSASRRRVGESALECLKENWESRRLPDSASRGVATVSRGVAIRIF
jgi:hypothetical protein